MIEPSNIQAEAPEKATWESALDPMACSVCGQSFLALPSNASQTCPLCYTGILNPLPEGLNGLPYPYPPELLLPFNSQAPIAGELERFAHGVPFAPPGLNFTTLKARLRQVFLPVWLVDTQVQGQWQAEAGFNYEVVSHQDQFNETRGGWSSRQVTETRVRWEPRLGQLTRMYENVPAAALEENARVLKTLGDYKREQAVTYQPGQAGPAFIRLPNRDPEDAWGDAIPAIQSRAAEECRQAAGADHIRQFSWQPQYNGQNWTLMLCPLYTSYYQDDEGRLQPVIIHGQTGRLYGARRASMRRAQRAALVLLVAALVIFLLSLALTVVGVAAPPLLAGGGFGLVLALLVGLSALVPVATVWGFNRQQPAVTLWERK